MSVIPPIDSPEVTSRKRLVPSQPLAPPLPRRNGAVPPHSRFDSSKKRPDRIMSKLNGDLLAQAVEDILAYSAGETIHLNGDDVKGKKRNFNETIELQIALK
ncbi:hypothetical protein BBJ28_00011816, partial [Nothophytophthora sp. Chile5]